LLETFYYNTIKKVLIGFGTLFNDISIIRKDSSDSEIKRIKVPIIYSPKQKFIARANASDPELEHNYAMKLPRMGFEISGIGYDSNRKQITAQKTAYYTDTSSSSLITRLERVPYQLTISLHILAKNSDDGLQIVEQILPYFAPDFCITLEQVGVDGNIDVPITIVGLSFDENFEGTFEEERKRFLCSIQFTAKFYLYGPHTRSKIITQSEVNFYDRYDINNLVIGATGATAETIIVGVTGGATAGSIGATGSTFTRIIRYE